MEVSFYCYLSAPGVEKRNQKQYLSEFLSDITGYLRVLGDRFVIVLGFSSVSGLMLEPNFLQCEFDDEECLLLPFVFQYRWLEEVYLRLDLLQSSLLNLCYKKGIDCRFEFHLEGAD